MSLEIIFRGLRVDGKGWVYGSYFLDTYTSEHFIADVRIAPESVGQYTGKKCKITGDRIFAADIVKDYQGGIYHIVYDAYYAAFMLRSSMIYSGAKRMDGNYEKVGNIFDDTFTEPEPRGIEPPSKTPSSDSFTRRNQKESLRGIK